jgi:hypothetical protein
LYEKPFIPYFSSLISTSNIWVASPSHCQGSFFYWGRFDLCELLTILLERNTPEVTVRQESLQLAPFIRSQGKWPLGCFRKS